MSHYSLLHKIDAANPELPDLHPLIARWHNERIRRIDRYIQLCVAGGLNCVADRKLPANTGVYLASRAGAVNTSAAAMCHIQQNGQLPKPLHFVNTLGNSAGYYLTRLLQVSGNTLVVSDEELSFEAALAHACLDLQAGHTDTALVGGFDEVATPIAQHLERLEAPALTTALYEGSHWLLLETKSYGSCMQLDGINYFNGLDKLARWLSHQNRTLHTAFSTNSDEQALFSGYVHGHKQSALPQTLTHGTFSGAALISTLEKSQSIIYLSRKKNGGYVAISIINNSAKSP